MGGWIGCDFDGTLARHVGSDITKLGMPIARTVRRVQAALDEGTEVRVFTARVSGAHISEERAKFVELQRQLISDWTVMHVGRRLTVTCEKDFACIAIWDDRARGVVLNEGIFIEEKLRAEAAARLVLAQLADFSSRGLNAPWRAAVSTDLNEFEQEAVAELVSQTGLVVNGWQPREGGGHTAVVGRGVVTAGAGTLVGLGGRLGR